MVPNLAPILLDTGQINSIHNKTWWGPSRHYAIELALLMIREVVASEVSQLLVSRDP